MSFTKQDKAKLRLFRKNQRRIKQVQSKIAGMKRWRDRLDVLAALSNVAQIASGVVMFFILGPNNNGFEYMVVPDLINGFGTSLNISLQATVQIFAFVGYAALGIRALWDLGVTVHRVYFIHSANNIVKLNLVQPSITLPTQTHLMVRTTANLLIAAFNIIAVITVLGLFSTGLGLVFAVVATGIDWVKDSIIPWSRTRETIKELRKELQQVVEELPQGLPSHPSDLQFEKITGQIERMEAECAIKRNSMLLNAVSFIAFALFVTGPFGFFTLGTVGSVLLVACTAVGIGRIICNSCNKNSRILQEDVRQHAMKCDEESEVEFHQRIKLHHWLEESGKKLDAEYPIPGEAPTHYPAIIPIKRKEDTVRSETVTVSLASADSQCVISDLAVP